MSPAPLVDFEQEYQPKIVEELPLRPLESPKTGRHTIGKIKAAGGLPPNRAYPMISSMVAKKGASPKRKKATPTWYSENRHAAILRFLAQKSPPGVTTKEIIRHLAANSLSASYSPRVLFKSSYSKKTITRDIEHLVNDKGFNIVFDRPRQKWIFYNPPPNLTLGSRRLSKNQMIALRMAASPIAIPGHPFRDAMRETLQQVAEMLEDDQKQQLHDSTNLLDVKMTPLIDLNLETIALLEEAIREKRETRMKYRGLQDRTHQSRQIQPHGLYHRNGGWYVAAYDRSRKAMRSFLISRAKNWQLTQKPFKPQNFSLEGFLSGSFGAMSGRGAPQKVRIRLFGAAARLGEERIWHNSQTTELGSRRKDGSIVVSFVLRGLDEVRRWVLQWEGEAEVMEPRALKDQVKKAGQKIHQRS
jgi:predicted DNA-binding transcriptional regulator YafY